MQRFSVFSFLTLSKPTAQCPRLHLGQAAAELFCSHTHFHVTLTCQCAQNCQTLLKALDAMCNSFNTRPCRYPYHCSNGVLMPPCIPRACTRQLVIHLIYSTLTRSGPCARVVLTARIHGRTLGSLRPSEVISGSCVILSQGRKTSFMASFLQPRTDSTSWGTNEGELGGEKSLDKNCYDLWKGLELMNHS